MDVGWEGVFLIWLGFLWPAAFVVVCKFMARRRDARLNGFLALAISYAVYIGASYLPIIPLRVMGVEGFLESAGETYAYTVILAMFGIAIIVATILLLFIFRKMEKQSAT